MKATKYVSACVITIGLALSACNDQASSPSDNTNDDSARTVDSSMSANHRDPSTAFPQPPVTGTQQDSSRTKDSTKRP